MAELADATDSKSVTFGCEGSSPSLGTIFYFKKSESRVDLEFLTGTQHVLSALIRFAIVTVDLDLDRLF